jgi:anti-sigma factor RsiW
MEMPMHLDEERLQRLLHGELPAQEEKAAREHLAACMECGGRLAEAEREDTEVHALLRSADRPAPRVGADTIVARAATRHLELSRVAAAILLALGMIAVAAYAAPGSPLKAWVGAMVEWVGGGSGRSRAAVERRVSGIAVAPGRQLIILFTSSQSIGRAEVSLTDDAEVVVRAPIGAATYTSGAEQLTIDNRGSAATFEIQIPRTAPRIEIRLEGSLVFLKEAERVVSDASGASGSYLLPLMR